MKLDLATGTRTAAASEAIRYSTAWVDGAASGATAAEKAAMRFFKVVVEVQ